ncbi:iron uptake porin [Almyronema epifaneia]|uniref:Iron uptake porin n=1 Tax=Almyronema epifaneia S1 TaxID=2991925 RepID=A0ABW6IDF4_9CYAN
MFDHKYLLLGLSTALVSVALGGDRSWAAEAAADFSANANASLAAESVEFELLASEGAEPVVQVAQTTSVTELSDVQPGDWAYQALRTLIEEYRCLRGYPDNTFRGNQTISRYEFAASLTACLDAIVAIAPEHGSVVNRLEREFEPELIARVETLEARVDDLESNQFSDNTRLFGQVIFGVQGRSSNEADFFPVDGVRDVEDPGDSVNLITNAQLSLLTQLNPRTLLLTGLQVGQGRTAPSLTNNVRLGYEGDTDNIFTLSDLTVRHLISDNFALIIGAEGVNPVNVFRGANRIESAGSGPLSAFAQRNPIISIGGGRGGLGFDWQIANRLSLQGVYTSSGPSDPQGGLFGGDNSDTTFGVQFAASPTDNLDIALHYLNSYSTVGNLRTNVGDTQLTAGDPLQTNAIGATASWQISPNLTLGGWGGYTRSESPDEPGDVETTNWMVFLNFPDLFGEGHLGGIYLGQPPRISSSTLRQGQNIPDLLAGGFGDPGDQPGTTTHLEVFYRYQLTDNISITPGIITIFEPANTPDSETITIGAVRTTLRF